MEQKLTFDQWSDQTQEELNNGFSDFMGVIKWAYRAYQNRILYACSFGAEGMVLIDLISKVTPDATIVFLDTDLHFKETYDLIEKTKGKYPKLNIRMARSNYSLDQQAEEFGDRLWESDPDTCCYLRKIEPLKKELANVDAWISGLRRDQSITRKNTQFINKDHTFQKVKICPLIHWTWEDVWNYIELNELPYNELHNQNYPSIGCEMCTLPVALNGDYRSGRWSGSAKKECGLHQD
ncbi:phosphoadenylyl-sulfate reductase [Virgibacillus xinjiangensis]|uniref:Adenosine 5'-phosphosulfate reductase n=1 Tax=Virgibacillus xinjiangensis TaxID=393090 RepID=A0ABV7CVX5_9BACI